MGGGGGYGGGGYGGGASQGYGGGGGGGGYGSAPSSARGHGAMGYGSGSYAGYTQPQVGPGPPIQKGKTVSGPRGANLFIFHLPSASLAA